jgi:putative FmdB family regulatory protein
MPIYEYKCEKGHTLEVMQRMADNSLEKCTVCEAPVRRVFHPIAVHFKGSGFYNTDYGKQKGKGNQSESDSSDSGSSESKSSESKSSESKSSDSKSSDSKTSSDKGSSSSDGGKSDKKASTKASASSDS